jgi:hypothetical protein
MTMRPYSGLSQGRHDWLDRCSANLAAAMNGGGKKSSKIRVAVECMVDAGRCRGDAAACGGPEANDNLAFAQTLERAAVELRIPKKAPIIRSGEVIATADESDPPWEIANTLRNPDQVAIEASATRTRLLLDQPEEMVALAVDMAESLRAENSAEKMLAHQLATLHVLMMKVSKRALDFGRYNNGSHGQFTQEQSVELSRHCNTAARLSSAFQDGLTTMQTLRTGSRQTVRVEHVTVEAGAQAVIGTVTTGGRRRAKAGRG